MDVYDVSGDITKVLVGLGSNIGLVQDLESSQNTPSKSPNVLDLSYITENVIGMAFPHEPEVARVHGGNDIRAVASFLKRRHEGHFMIWNLSEEAYNYTPFNDQVYIKTHVLATHPFPTLSVKLVER